MKILLTGGTGLMGRTLCPRLIQAGHSVNVLGRGSNAMFTWNGEKEPPPIEALRDIEAVIHLAGEGIADKRWTVDRKERLRQSRLLSTQNLQRGLADANVQPAIYIGASGIGAYGDCGDKILTEASAFGQGFLPDLCQEWEAAHLKVLAQKHTILRFGIVLSGDGGFLGKVVPMFRTFGASRLASGEQWLSWIHSQDLVEVFLLALQGKISGVVNACAPEPVTNREMTSLLAEALSVFKAPPVPRLALKALYGELGDSLLESQRAKPQALIDNGFQFQMKDFKTALAQTELPRSTVIGQFFGSR